MAAQLYSTTGVYPPGNTTTPSYLQTTYQLFTGNNCHPERDQDHLHFYPCPPSSSLPCATINADGVVTQLGYDSAGDLVSSSTPDGNGSELATTTSVYDSDGEQTSTAAPDGNLSGASPATAANYTTVTAYSNDGQKITVTQAGGTGATATARTTTSGYDANCNQVTVKSPRVFTTTTIYNADDRRRDCGHLLDYKVVAQVCGTFTIGKAYTDYKWGQNTGAADTLPSSTGIQSSKATPASSSSVPILRSSTLDSK